MPKLSSRPTKPSPIHRLILPLVLLVFSFVLALPMVRSGLSYSYGIGFWGPNGHDGIWHLSLINHAANPVSIPLASFSGQPLQNYHPFYDTLLAWLSTLTGLSPSIWLFQIMPLLLSFLFLFLSFKIVYRLSGNLLSAYMAVFLGTFANSFGWLVSFLRNGTLAGESMFWSSQSLSLQINPPYAFSLVLLLTLIYVVISTKNNHLSRTDTFIIFLLLTLIPVTKAYAAVPAFGFFFIYSIIASLKRDFRPLIVFAVSLTSATLVFWQYNSSASGLIRFQPFWFVQSMIDSPDRLYLPRLSSYIHTATSVNKLSLGLIAAQSLAVLIFLVGNFSWRLLGIFAGLFSKNAYLRILFFLSLVTTSIPLIFIQQGTSWNTIQFLYYSLVLSNFLLAIFVSRIKNTYIKSLLIAIIISTSLLASLPHFQNYLGDPPPSALPAQELTALSFLARQPKGLVLTYPYDPYLKTTMSTPIPLYAYETSSYVSAFTRHFVYMADEMNLDITGYDWQHRRLQSDIFFRQLSPYQDRGFLVNNRIDYIYLTGLQVEKTNLATQDLSLKEIFRDSTTVIFQVQR